MEPFWARPEVVKGVALFVLALIVCNVALVLLPFGGGSERVEVLGAVVEAPRPTTTQAVTYALPGPTVAPTVVEASQEALSLAAQATTTTTVVVTTTLPAPTTSANPPATTTALAIAAEQVARRDVAAADSEVGVFVTPRGVVTPVIARDGDGWQVQTPCGIIKTLLSGTRVSEVDIVVDPGHGGSEPGTSGGGLAEKDLNLAVSVMLADILRSRGYSVLLTRTTDIRIPIRSRADIANALRPDVFVSVHHNGGATRSSSDPGTEIYYDGGKPAARRLGTLVYDRLQAALSAYPAAWVDSVRQGVSARLREDGADLYGIHRYTPDVPSIITEAGYLSNEAEAAVFARPEVQRAEAQAIADGIVEYLTTENSGSGALPDFVDGSSSGTGGFENCVDPDL